MAKIDCVWDAPEPKNTDDSRDWTVAQLLAGRLPADWTVRCGHGSPCSIVLQDAAGQEQLRLDGILDGQRYHALTVFLMDAVGRFKRRK